MRQKERERAAYAVEESMSAQKDAQREPLPPEGEFARDPMLWVVPALSSLFSRSAPSPGAVSSRAIWIC